MKIPWYSWKEHPKAFVVQLFIGAMGLLTVAGLYLVFVTPTVSRTIVASQNDRATLLADIKVRFSLPVSREKFTPKITPEIDGNWLWTDPLIAGRLYRTAVFEPASPLSPNTTYKVELTGITGLISTQTAEDHSFTFTTQPLPSIKSVTVGAPHKINDAIAVELDYPAGQAVEYFFSISPEAELEVNSSSNNLTYSIVPKSALRQGVEYELLIEREIVQFDNNLQRVLRRSNRELVEKKKFSTVSPLGIVSVEPQGNDILPNTRSLSVTFAEEVLQDKATEFLILAPKQKGEWQWKSAKVIEYVFAEKLEFEQNYKLTISAGLLAKNSSTLQSAGEYSFTTVGPLEVRSISPTTKSSGVSLGTSISIKFNQPADRSSVEQSITLTPSIEFSKDWKSDTTIQLSPKTPFDYSTKYTVSIGTGAMSQYQKPLKTNFLSSFSTEEKIVVLAVPLDKQDRALSCEVASLKMALAYKGVFVSEDHLMSHIGYDPTTRSGGIWGDPEVAFVGDINGSQNTTGYGVYWQPIAKAANNYRKSTAHTNLSLQDLAKAIDEGNPIVTWGTHGSAYYDPWTTPSGKLVPAWKGEHARTVIGYKGNTNSPTAIITNDPIAGKIVWKAADFDVNWARLSRAGVIVY